MGSQLRPEGAGYLKEWRWGQSNLQSAEAQHVQRPWGGKEGVRGEKKGTGAECEEEVA